jgi:hypothetical protein
MFLKFFTAWAFADLMGVVVARAMLRNGKMEMFILGLADEVLSFQEVVSQNAALPLAMKPRLDGEECGRYSLYVAIGIHTTPTVSSFRDAKAHQIVSSTLIFSCM